MVCGIPQHHLCHLTRWECAKKPVSGHHPNAPAGGLACPGGPANKCLWGPVQGGSGHKPQGTLAAVHGAQKISHSTRVHQHWPKLSDWGWALKPPNPQSVFARWKKGTFSDPPREPTSKQSSLILLITFEALFQELIAPALFCEDLRIFSRIVHNIFSIGKNGNRIEALEKQRWFENSHCCSCGTTKVILLTVTHTCS